MSAQYIIQKTTAHNKSGLALVSEKDIVESASEFDLAVYNTRKECRAAIRMLLDTKPENAPYEIIRIHFTD